MPLFAHRDFDAHEQVVFCHDAASGLKAIIAIHDTTRGPSLGGCRMWPYATEDEALTDALRLARGMTYKSALAGLPYGGGKSVIIGDPHTMKSEALFLAMGRFVDTLGGRYVIAEDVGISVEDVEIMARATRHVAGIPAAGAGDPSPATAYGVFMGIRAAVAHAMGCDSLDGLHVAVQGLGHVGYHLCRNLVEAGTRLTVSDIDANAVARVCQEFSAESVAPEAIYDVAADVFAPCALGAEINDRTIPRLKARIIAGSANNQLAEPRHGAELAQRNILYAPDYVINAGGVIYISHEGPSFDETQALAHVARIHDTLGEIFTQAKQQGIPTSEAADRLAQGRLRRHTSIAKAHAAA
ncbi:MAG: Glu/Leu/Phe/Val dehydrogenase dimerization domain-containing protein [Alphaproteobacteria bacterium]